MAKMDKRLHAEIQRVLSSRIAAIAKRGSHASGIPERAAWIEAFSAATAAVQQINVCRGALMSDCLIQAAAQTCGFSRRIARFARRECRNTNREPRGGPLAGRGRRMAVRAD